MLGSAEGADKGVFVTLAIETDQVDLLTLMALLSALDVLDDVAGNLLLHLIKDLYLKST